MRRVLVWTPALDPLLLPALREQGIEIVCQLGGDSGLVPAYATETLFAADAPQLRWLPPSQRFALPPAALHEYVECIFRLSVIPGTRAMDTSTPGFVFGDNVSDWAQIHACILEQILVEHRPDEVWLVDHPHLGLDHLLAFLADRRGLPVLFLMQSRVPCKFQVFRWQAGSSREVAAGEFSVTSDGAQPPYVFNQPLAPESRLRAWRSGLRKLAFYTLGWLWAGLPAWSDRVYNGLIRKDWRAPMLPFDLCGRRTRPLALYRFLRWRRHRRDLRRRRMADAGQLGAAFVYFPLHYEPESGPRFESGDYCNQVNAIEAICRMLPAGWSLLVKENPLQPYYARSEAFFRRLEHLPQVRFVDDRTPSLDLIRACRVVATLNGTAGYEALLEGRPSVHFGRPWYHGLPGTHRYQPQLDLQQLSETPVDREALDQAMRALQARTPDGMVFPRYLEMLDPGHDRAELCAQTARSLRRVSDAVRQS